MTSSQSNNKIQAADRRLTNLTNALYFTDSGDIAIRTGITGNINISGPVTIPGSVELGATTLAALETINANVSGSVNIGTMPEVEVKNDSGNPLSVSANTTANSSTNPIYVKGTSDTSFFSATQSDAFGRLRVSEPYTLADHFNRFQDNGLSSNYAVNGGSFGYNANNAAVTLTVGTGSSDAAYRESNRVYAYQPGKSLLVMQSFTFAAAKTNLTQRAGYFDQSNGIYLEQAGSSVYFVKRTSVSGAMLETRIPQSGISGWNVNQLPSLDLSKSQIFWMDIEWLGVGSVRCGFVIDGQFIHCHTFNHANLDTGVYMTTSCLPVRKEIFNTGTTASSSTMMSICTSVVSEGGYSLTGRERCIGHNIGSGISLPNDSSLKPIMSIRLKSSRLNGIVLPTTFSVVPVQQAVYKYNIYTQGITSGGSWVSAGSDSSVEYNLSPTAIVSGNISSSGFINASNQSSGAVSNNNLPFRYQLERNSFTSTPYEIIIAVASSTNSTTAYGSINWEEIT